MINLDVGFALQVGGLLVFIPMMDRLVFRRIRAVTDERAARLSRDGARADEAARSATTLEKGREDRLNAARHAGIGVGQERLDSVRRATEESMSREIQEAEESLKQERRRLRQEVADNRPALEGTVEELAELLARNLVQGGSP